MLKKILIGIGVLLFILLAGGVGLAWKTDYLDRWLPQTIKEWFGKTEKPEEEAAAKKLISYKSINILRPQPQANRIGFWEYSIDTGEGQQLLSFEDLFAGEKDSITKGDKGLNVYALSVNNKRDKVMYAIGVSTGESGYAGYDLYLYDIKENKNTLLASDLNLVPGYIQDIIWDSSDEYAYFVLSDKSGSYKLHKIYLDGRVEKLIQNSKENMFWPKLVGNYLVFAIADTPDVLPSTYKIGIYNLRSGELVTAITETENYFYSVFLKSDRTLIKVKGGALGSVSISFKDGVYGLEQINLDDNSASTYPIPAEINLTPTTQRIQSGILCGNYVLIERVVKDESTVFGESVSDLWLFNLLNETLEASPISTGKDIYFNCFNYRYITWDKDNTRYSLDTQTKELTTLNYSSLDYWKKEESGEQCLGSSLIFDEGEFKVIQVDGSLTIAGVCSDEEATGRWGLYLYDPGINKATQFYKYTSGFESDQILSEL